MLSEDTSMEKGIFSLLLGTLTAVAATYFAFKLFNGAGASEAAAIAENTKNSICEIIAYSGLGLLNAGLSVINFVEGIHNIKEELTF